MRCDNCGKEIVAPSPMTTGYGITRDNKKFCYACCGEVDRLEIEGSDRFTLYLCKGEDGSYSVSNWPGTLRFPAWVHTGRHNLARVVYYATFKDHTGARWYGKTVGEWTQICHCRRYKS